MSFDRARTPIRPAPRQVTMGWAFEVMSNHDPNYNLPYRHLRSYQVELRRGATVKLDENIRGCNAAGGRSRESAEITVIATDEQQAARMAEAYMFTRVEDVPRLIVARGACPAMKLSDLLRDPNVGSNPSQGAE